MASRTSPSCFCAQAALATCLILMAAGPCLAQNRTRWLSVTEVYGEGKHNAWPDLCKWRDRYYIVFPGHGHSHGGGHGVVILSSKDTVNWQKTFHIDAGEWQLEGDENWPAETLFFLPTADRLIIVFWSRAQGDMNVTDDRKAELHTQWMALGGSEDSWKRWLSRHETAFRSRIVYSEDGVTWSKPKPLLPNRWWLWRPATFKGRHYMVGYRNHAQQWEMTPELESMIPRADDMGGLDTRFGDGIELFNAGSLFASDDGLKWQKVSDIAANDDTEPGVNFSPDGRCLVVSRNGAAGKPAIAYVSDPPYTQWKTLQLDQMIHQAAIIHYKGRWIVGGRNMEPFALKPNRHAPDKMLEGTFGTRLWFLDDQTGALTDATSLPSWGDCGQPAFWPADNGDLLVAYYSCSQTIERNRIVGGGPFPGKSAPTSIYLARVHVD